MLTLLLFQGTTEFGGWASQAQYHGLVLLLHSHGCFQYSCVQSISGWDENRTGGYCVHTWSFGWSWDPGQLYCLSHLVFSDVYRRNDKCSINSSVYCIIQSMINFPFSCYLFRAYWCCLWQVFFVLESQRRLSDYPWWFLCRFEHKGKKQWRQLDPSPAAEFLRTPVCLTEVICVLMAVITPPLRNWKQSQGLAKVLREHTQNMSMVVLWALAPSSVIRTEPSFIQLGGGEAQFWLKQYIYLSGSSWPLSL